MSVMDTKTSLLLSKTVHDNAQSLRKADSNYLLSVVLEVKSHHNSKRPFRKHGAFLKNISEDKDLMDTCTETACVLVPMNSSVCCC